LCCFYHSSIISTISFHPKNDRYFVSACLAGKLRLWNISDKKVIHWNELSNTSNGSNGSNFITAICFCQSGKTIAVGTYDGKCILYQTEVCIFFKIDFFSNQ
jgi:WD40 repeat protein